MDWKILKSEERAVLKALRTIWRQQPPITATEELQEFLRREAAFLAQKATVEYCRARSGLNWDKLFAEQAFREALDVCRWEAFAAVLADMIVVAEGLLRPAAGAALPAVAERLAGVYGDILRGEKLPAHRPGGWADAIAALPDRLARAQLAAPQAPHEVAGISGARVYDVLPIHPQLRRLDREMVVNSIRFGMVSFRDKLAQRADATALARDLIGPAVAADQA